MTSLEYHRPNPGCSACDGDCEATFVCHLCHQRKHVCNCLVGGFEATELVCEQCHFGRATGLPLPVVKRRNKRKEVSPC